MERVTLPEARQVAVLLGPGTVVGLLIAAATYTPPQNATPLNTQLWCRICMVVFALLTAFGVVAYILPHLGLKWRTPWYRETYEGPANQTEPNHVNELVALYRENKQVGAKILDFVKTRYEAKPESKPGKIDATLQEAGRWTVENADLFNKNIRPIIVRHRSKLASRGLSSTAMDNVMLDDVLSLGGMSIIGGELESLGPQILEMMAEELPNGE